MAENITAKIQVRRGELEDLPTLAEGEFGYALDGYRLFVGNTPVTFAGDSVTSRFTIQDRTIISSHLLVTVNATIVSPGIEYNVDGTDIIFAVPPESGDIIVASFNTEITTQKHLLDTLRVGLAGNVYDVDLGLNFNLSNYNTAVIEYSLKTTSGAMRIGTLKLISDGISSAYVDDISSGFFNSSDIKFNTRIESNRLYITYTNKSFDTANFYYSIKLWNTI